MNPISRTFVCECPPLRLKVEPVASDPESNVTIDIRPGVIRPDTSAGRALPGTPEARVRIPVVTCCFSLLSWLVIYLLFNVKTLSGGVR